MTESLIDTACPLCGSHRAVTAERVLMAPIATYWQGMGYDLKSAFPGLPDELEKRDCPRCALKFFLPRLIGGPDLYAALQTKDYYYGASKWEFTAVLKYLSTGSDARTLLEFGCGAGRFLEQAEPYFEEARGIDFNEDAVALCRRKGLVAEVTDLAAINRMFDVVVAFQIMEHVAEPGQAFDDLAALVEPGGLLVVAVPNEDGPLGELQENFLNLPPHHFTRWSRRTLDYLAASRQLQLEHYSCEPLSEVLYLTLLNERFSRGLAADGLVARLFAALARRIATARALVDLDAARERLPGHTQIAAFRKPGSGVA